MIPKKIHYCWFGFNPIPELVLKCFENWKEKLPDYEIIVWNESNYDINKNTFVKEAYDNKKWAFVSDYARLDILYNNGGIYIDTDVQIIKSFDDLLCLKGFCGFENSNNSLFVNTGSAIGMEKGLEICRDLMDIYENLSFNDNIDNLSNITCPILQTNKLVEMGLEIKNEKQTIKGLTIFPTDYFCPLNYDSGITNITDNTYSIHLYFATWFTHLEQERQKLRLKYAKYGPKISKILANLIAYKNEYGLFVMWKKIIEKIFYKLRGKK